MAAGLVVRTITVSSGVDVPTLMWADDTVTPTQLTPVHIFVGTDGVPVGPLTDTQLRATAVPVSGTVTASGPVTDTQLRATPVPVSGTITADAGAGSIAGGTVAAPSADILTIQGPGTRASERITDTAGTSTAFTNFGATASIRNHVTAYSAFNASATDGFIDIRDGTAGAVLWTIPLPAGGGANLSNGGLPLFSGTANTALAYDVSAALTTVYLSISGFRAA